MFMYQCLKTGIIIDKNWIIIRKSQLAKITKNAEDCMRTVNINNK